jgi:SAM-dependent methyltransferase
MGYDLVRTGPPDPRYVDPSFDSRRTLPPGASDELRSDHPRLIELRARYARCRAPMAIKTVWAHSYLETQLSLPYFRGDNSYVWQFRNIGAMATHKYFFYLREVAARDTRGLLETLEEDGAFGCWTFDYPGWPTVSRDLLDSINELEFLDRELDLLDTDWTVLDIGAGYGRLAHRMLAAAPKLTRYICVDAVPESTFLCEYYLRFRGCMDRAEVVPLDELDARLPGRTVQLAVNIHSFSEMGSPAIAGWLSWLAELEVPWLLIVPNDGRLLLTSEETGERHDFAPLVRQHGYELARCEPVFPDPTMREFMRVGDHFFLFRRVTEELDP